jgi:hypothetical protein
MENGLQAQTQESMVAQAFQMFSDHSELDSFRTDNTT